MMNRDVVTQKIIEAKVKKKLNWLISPSRLASLKNG